MARDEAEVAFNVAYRILGSRGEAAEAAEEALHVVPREEGDDRRSALLAATSRACHRLVPKPQRGLPTEAVPASADSENAVAAASMRLPIRQREALALDELGGLSYGQIATIMEVGDRAVAQLVSRARINLNDELRGTVVASVAAPSPDCERALPLIAAREDGQLEGSSPDAAWLDVHLGDCERCRLAAKATREAADAYRSWAPLATPAALLATTETAAAAAEPEPVAPAGAEPRRSSRRPVLAAGLAALLLVGVAIAFLGNDPAAPPLDPAAEAAPAPNATLSPSAKGAKAEAEDSKRKSGGKPDSASTPQAEGGEAATPVPVTVTAAGGEGGPSGGGGEPDRSQGETAVEPTQPTSVPGSSAKPKPAPTAATTSQPAEPAPAPVAEEAPVADEDGPGKGKEPPGKAVGRPPK